ncbi:ABC transporter substrate-binding protein [Mycetocola saprophilus]|uniref:ABC transporter substrate-binding protein n=1 Tax=Mycetocola saprophilus TaxID=76636 RepID=UPI003BF1C555
MNTHRRLLGFAVPALLLGSALALSACSAVAPTEPVSTDKTLVYASGDAEPTCLDPHVGGNYPQSLLAAQFLEQLVSENKDGEFTPWLAKSWTTSPDGLTWNFTLADNVKFSDGTPLDAAAVVRNIEHVQDPETKSSTGYLALAKVSKATATDAHTVTLNLSQPDSALLESLSQPWLAIESPAGLARSQDENCQAPIGTGAFVVDSWKRQDSVTLSRNPHYTTGKGEPALAKITWRFIPDSATRIAALRSGDVQMIDNAQPDTIAASAASDEIKHLDAPRPGSVNRIEFNSSRGPLADERVREALVRGVDVNAGIKTLFFGTATRSYSPLSSVEKLGFSEPKLFDTDANAAKKLLDEAGWVPGTDGIREKDGQKLSLKFPVSTNQSIPAEQSLFEQIQEQAKGLGIAITITPLDLSSWYEALGKNDYDLVSAPYTKVGPDVLRILYHSAGITPAPSGYFANHAQVNLPALDDLLTRAAETGDQTERASLYEQAQKTILEGYYILPLYDQQNHFLYSGKLAGVGEVNSVGNPLLRGVSFAG